MKRQMVAATAWALLQTSAQALATNTDAAPLIGTWNAESKEWFYEYAIEKVHNDGSIEGTLCIVRKDGYILGIPLKGAARSTDDGRSMEVRHPGSRGNARMIDHDTLQVVAMGRVGWKGPAQTWTMKRTERAECAHRFVPAQTTHTDHAQDSEPLVGSWMDLQWGKASGELSVEQIEGKHAQGRACTRAEEGGIYLFDFYKGGPNEATYDPQSATLRLRDTSTSRGTTRHIEFTPFTRDKILRTSTTEGGERTTETMRVLSRGQNPEGCLARTSARVRSITGTWRPKRDGRSKMALKITEDHGGARIAGVLCTAHKGGKVTATWFGDHHGGPEAAVRANENEIEIFETTWDRETTHVLRTEPDQPNRVLYQHVRDDDAEGEGGGETKLRRTSKKTCARALRTPPSDDNAPASGEGGHGLLGEWSGTNQATETVTEVRVERFRQRNRPVGVICERSGPNSIRYWNLNHPRIKATKHSRTTIRWERKRRTHAVENDTHESLVLSESAGQEFLAHILRVKGAKTETTVMRRGHASEGCLAYIARQTQ